MKRKYKLAAILLLVIVSVVAFSATNGGDKATGPKVTVFKSASCGCCGGYAGGLNAQGFDVDIVVSEMDDIKLRFNIPRSMQSCHTSVIGDYFVEGHVPYEAVDKLLTEQPDIDGIALPNMPAGTPGMPGVKKGPYVIYSLKNGEISEFMRL